jgi:hypothetical protein
MLQGHVLSDCQQKLSTWTKVGWQKPNTHRRRVFGQCIAPCFNMLHKL